MFTCPVAGYYAIGYNGIHNGGSGIPATFNTYGYGGFAKNGSLAYWNHWNLSSNNSWNTGGTSALFFCAAGDTLTMHINTAPAPTGTGDAHTYNTGLYPDSHHAVWCKRVG